MDKDIERTGDCSFGYVGTPLVPTYGTIKPRGGLAVKKSYIRSTCTKSGYISSVYLETNISSVLLKSPVDTMNGLRLVMAYLKRQCPLKGIPAGC